MAHLLDSVSPVEERSLEQNEKWSRLIAFMDEQKLSALLLRRLDNIAWITAGQVDVRIAIPNLAGACSLLLMRDGRRYYLAASLEAARLAAEEFEGLDYEAVITPWHTAADPASIERLAGTKAIGVDIYQPEFAFIDIAALRAPLTSAEVKRLRWLCSHAAEVIATSLAELAPGITEDEMAAKVSERLIAQSILPSVLLMAVDDRIRSYKHAPARGAVLQQYGMLNLCARKWGLAVSITRLVHFGQPLQQLVDAFAACAEVNARMQHASRSGATSSDLFAVAQSAYAAAGYPGEEQNHHQGGPIAYAEREWLAVPGGTQALAATQALAWNPSIRGAKVEDTTLLQNGAIEVLTQTPSLPYLDVSIEGTSYRAANLLIR